jgi:hypothetical protein
LSSAAICSSVNFKASMLNSKAAIVIQKLLTIGILSKY